MRRLSATLLVVLSALFLPVLAPAAGKNNGPFISMHPEGSKDEGQRMVRPDRLAGQVRYFRISPEVSGRHFGAYQPFVAEDGNGMGAVLFLNAEGIRAMQIMCTTSQGKLARIIVNGRPVDTVRLDRAPADGRVVIWGGLGDADFKAFDKSKKLKRIGGGEPARTNS